MKHKAEEGLLRIGFGIQGGRTIAHSVYHTGNLRLSSAIYNTREETPYYFLIATGGGFVEGEHYITDITVDDGAHGILTTQTPTYIYKCDHDEWTTQEMKLQIGKDATLELYADEVIPYKNARYRQDVVVDMQPGSTLYLTDGFSSGWSPDGQAFQYREIALKTTVHYDGKLIVSDFLLSAPRRDEMNTYGMMEGYEAYHSLLIVDECITAAHVQMIREALDAVETPSVYGVSLLEEKSLVLRVLGPTSFANRKLLRVAANTFREQVKGAKPLHLRKNDT